MSIERNKAVVRRCLQALWQGNMVAVGEHPGLGRLREVVSRMLAAFPDLEAVIVSQIGEGDLVATCITYHGTHQGELFGFPPSQKEVMFDAFAIDQIVDGKVVQHNGAVDWARVLVDLGAGSVWTVADVEEW